MSPLTATLVLLLAGAALASTATEWAKYKQKHHKLYSQQEDARRMKIWMKNVAMVERHNREKHSYTMAINKFSDWTKEEVNTLMGFRPGPERSIGNFKTYQNVKTPEVVDYREEGKVSPVQDQGHCGSCWAFSANGAIEGLWAKNMGELLDLSEQQLLDCDSGSCLFGGMMSSAWNYVADVGGIQSEESYPYTAVQGQCQEDPSKYVAHVTDYEKVYPDESQMELALVEIGYPISIGVNGSADSFLKYKGGVYDDPSCKDGDLNHAVLIVGYDKSGPEPFWIVKNSWGGSWGEHGYIRMKMGVNSCGLKEHVVYPTRNL